MKKQGFTLIELLAVIIILAIIALIATPITLNIIENVRRSAFERTANGYYDAAKYLYSEMFLDERGKDILFTFENGTQTSSNENYKLEVQGEVPKEGVVYLSEDGYISVAIHNGKYCASSKEDGKVILSEDIENCLSKGLYTDKSGANQPELVNKLLPVVYRDGQWKVASTYGKWYDYDNKEWANAVILENGVTKNAGDTLNINTEVAQMYVWIPRYEYKIPTASIGKTDSDIHAIDIKFVDTQKTQANVDTGYNLHPGFKFGNQEVSGIWVGKFETTGESKDSQTQFTCTDANCTQKVTIKPNYRAAYGAVSNQFYASRSIASQYSLTNVDTHMAKYTEWTAISYLTNSIYGRCSDATHCTEVTINNSMSASYEGGYTGNAGNSISDSNYELKIYNAYDTTQGMTASTTGNITGVYDMSGGTYEYVMGVALDSTGNPRSGYDSSNNSGFNGMYYDGTEKTDGLAFPDSKYYDSFKLAGTDSYYYDDLVGVNGVDGDFRGTFKELLASPYTSDYGWYGDYAYSVASDGPWFFLGGLAVGSSGAGVFSSLGGSGIVVSNDGFRAVLVAS